MSDQPAQRSSRPADNHRGLRVIALAAVAVGVLLLAAAAFMLSYAGIHAIALQAGVSASLARIYPVIFDAMLVVTAASVLSLRGAGLLTRCYAWLTMLVLLAAAAGADAVHATAARIPHRPAAAAVAIIPWALVLIAFGLLMAMLRHARLRRAAGLARKAPIQAAEAQPAMVAQHGEAPAHLLPPVPAVAASARTQPVPAQLSTPAQASGPAQLSTSAQASAPAQTSAQAQASAPDQPSAPEPGYDDNVRDPDAPRQSYWRDTESDLAIEADAGQDDPTSDEAGQDDPTSDEASADGPSAAARVPADGPSAWVPRARQQEPAGSAEPRGQSAEPYGQEVGSLSPAPTFDTDDDDEPEQPAAPQFDRMRSSPTPPSN